MIIGSNWTYAHIPRTAGDTIQARLGLIAAVEPTKLERIYLGPFKHMPPETAGVNGSHRTIISLRRLPAWYMSWIAMMCGRLTDDGPITTWEGWKPAGRTCFGALWPDNIPHPVPSKAQIIGDEEYAPEGTGWDGSHAPLSALADRFLGEYLPRGTEPLTVWRCESLEMDLMPFLRDYLKMGESFWNLYEAVKIRKIPLKYNHNYREYFTAKEIERLYENNPRWAALEREYYGSLVTEQKGAGHEADSRTAHANG